MFGLRNKKNNFQFGTLIWRPDYRIFYMFKLKDKDKEALFNVAYNVTDNISS